jgi:SM-20-related protein
MILDDFVSDAQLQNLIQSDLVRLQEEGKFTTAKVGSVANVNQEIRVAETCFLQKQRPNPIRTLVLDRLGQLRHELSLIQPIEPELDDFLYIHYPQGGFYNKHVDATPNTPSDLRIYSVLLYLNTVQQGGQLRLFLDNDSIKDIAPKAGRLVVLDSHRIPHQVMETKEPRRVLVGWFHRAPTHEELLTYATSS